MDQQVNQTIVPIPPGTTHIEITTNKATGEVMRVLHYAEGELQALWAKITHALGLNNPEITPAVPAAAAEVPPVNETPPD